MRNSLKRSTLMSALAVAWLGSVGVAAAEPRVVASIKPIHSLAAAVMEGVGTPTLLVEGAASGHGYVLRPSDARALAGADLVFLVGEGLETYLVDPLAELADDARVVELAEVEGVALLPLRQGVDWEGDAHEDERGHAGAAEAQGHARYDGHVWLDPDNARRIVAAMAAALGEVDPDNAAAYRANAARVAERLSALDRDLAARLAPVRSVPYVVFHDAYQYFEEHYDLAAVGSIIVSPDRPPGARRLSEVRDKIATLHARCVFSEPQFEPALVETVREGTSARTGRLDPLGATLPDGPDLYFDLMRDLAESLRRCLAESS